MSANNSSHSGTYRVNLRLDVEADADLIGWLERYPNGQRSAAVREVIRRGLAAASQVETSLDLEAIREIVADELSKTLTGLQLKSISQEAETPEQNIEMEYGSKLDRMLGGVSQGSAPDPNNP